MSIKLDDKIEIDYYCQNCGSKKSNQDMESMLCTCGGYLRPDGELFSRAAIFEPHYCPVLRTYLTSYKQQERLAVAHRSRSHPEGLRLQQWDRKQINEYRRIRRYKEDYKQSQYPGYKVGQGKVNEAA